MDKETRNGAVKLSQESASGAEIAQTPKLVPPTPVKAIALVQQPKVALMTPKIEPKIVRGQVSLIFFCLGF